jgi:hypothetical protein
MATLLFRNGAQLHSLSTPSQEGLPEDFFSKQYSVWTKNLKRMP